MINYSNYSSTISYSVPGIVAFDSIQAASVNQVTLTIAKATGLVAKLDWGNGTIVNIVDGNNNYNSNYAAGSQTYPIKIYDNLDLITTFTLYNEDTVDFSLEQMKKLKNVTHFTASVIKTLRGSLENLPSKLQVINLNCPTVANEDLTTGTINNLPASLTELWLKTGSVNISGSISNFKEGLQIISLSDRTHLAQFSGLLDDLPSTLKRFDSTGAYGYSGNTDNLPAGLTALYMEDVNDDITGVLDNLPSGLLDFFIVSSTHGPHMTGSLDNLPVGLVRFMAIVCGTFTGSIENIPATINASTLWISGVGSQLSAVTGNIGNIKGTPNQINFSGLTGITGNFEDLPSTLNGLTFYGNGGACTTIGSGFPAWVLSVGSFTITDALSTAEVDNILIGLAAALPNGTATIYLAGSGANANQARSAASDAAYDTLHTTKGYTIVTT